MQNLPKHVAIIMDGNGRWAKRRLLPRVAGHNQGKEPMRNIVTLCSKLGIEILTLFAFSSENWKRPQQEVNFLLSLFLQSLKTETKELHQNNVRLKIIGDRTPFNQEFQTAMQDAETLTEHNTGLRLNIALNYGGRWDIVQAAKTLSEKVLKGEMLPNDITEETFATVLSLSDCPSPDLLIRTGGEQRISNFLLWDFAYTEIYFTETYWPDFRESEFKEALQFYAKRQRRFGSTSEQIENQDTGLTRDVSIDTNGASLRKELSKDSNSASLRAIAKQSSNNYQECSNA